jgi:hypothetical protein
MGRLPTRPVAGVTPERSEPRLTLTLSLPESQIAEIDRIAKAEERNRSQCIEFAVRLWISRYRAEGVATAPPPPPPPPAPEPPQTTRRQLNIKPAEPAPAPKPARKRRAQSLRSNAPAEPAAVSATGAVSGTTLLAVADPRE